MIDNVVSALDVAKYILERSGPMSTWKLQKLVYYSQAWSLVWDENRLFKEDIEAWVNGPVVVELYQEHKALYNVCASQILGDPTKLLPEQKETVDKVLAFYGPHDSQWLRDLTHDEDPWRKARAGLSDTQRSDRVIPLEHMNEYYSSL